MPSSELGATHLPESPPTNPTFLGNSHFQLETGSAKHGTSLKVPEGVWPRLGTKAPLPPADGRRYYSLHRPPSREETPEPLERDPAADLRRSTLSFPNRSLASPSLGRPPNLFVGNLFLSDFEGSSALEDALACLGEWSALICSGVGQRNPSLLEVTR